MSPREHMRQLEWLRLNKRLVGLGMLAVLSVLLYWQGITTQYPLAQGLLQPHTTWSPLVQFSLWAGMRHAVVYALLMLAYIAGLRLVLHMNVAQQRAAVVVIFVGWLLCSLTLLPSYPGDSLDIFDYLFRGRMQALFGANPLATTPDVFRVQPFYDYLTWGEWVDAYGPLWEYASGMVARLVGVMSGGELADYVVGYRLLAIALAGACGVLVALIARKQTPQHAVPALLAWLWNPLLLIATAVGGHNDGVMLVLMLGAMLMFQRRRWVLGLLLLGLAAHAKITALLLLPVFGVWLLRHCGWRRTLVVSALACVVMLPLSWLLYAPYGGWATLPRMLQERHILTYNSLANVAVEFLNRTQRWDVTLARQVAIRGAEGAFLVIAAGFLLVFWRRINVQGSDNTQLWRASVLVVLVYLLVGCFWFQYWYVLWAIMFTALLPNSRLTQVVLPCFALGALWSNLLTNFLIYDPAHHVKWVQINQLTVVTLFVPLLCALLGLGVAHIRGGGLSNLRLKRAFAR